MCPYPDHFDQQAQREADRVRMAEQSWRARLDAELAMLAAGQSAQTQRPPSKPAAPEQAQPFPLFPSPDDPVETDPDQAHSSAHPPVRYVPRRRVAQVQHRRP